ncbi:PAS domain-containing sensor histidine kinase [Mucilaginibacter dorajii]|uniref:histidine kinase n=1 Tax=Mucilaginibacter dorajii TaxID=692994 RepID=A0ABP7PVY0_9SPHI|nr:PAS domain-containing sensor histidine kinase [Mucilaginibacter dorajii]MCS3734955.1 PAS domain S-box-containing protein [Mucilaginibacter dorajii]
MLKTFGASTYTGFNFELFFELSADLFCIAGFDGYFRKINPTVSKVLGYSNEELFSRPINDFVHPDDRDITSQGRTNLTHDIPLLNFENRYVTKSGDIVWLAWTSMPIENEQLVFAIAKNITHKKKQEQERNALITSLTKINDDLKQLTYTTSHDLRSPVSNLLSVFGLMDTTRIQDEETLEFINMLKSATESLKETLNNYVDVLSQKDSLHVQIEEVDLNESLTAVLHSLSSLIQDSNTVININFTDNSRIRFNRAYLESIFLNLITNAIKYARPDVSPVINISSKTHNGIKQLIFADNGLGFDMETARGKVFGFHQKFHHHHDSKGIGLYLVYNHITSLGGQIVLKSKPNEGARFTISFKD